MERNAFKMFEKLNQRRMEVTRIRRLLHQNFDFIVDTYGICEFRDLKDFVDTAERKNEKLAEALSHERVGNKMQETLYELERDAKVELAHLKKCLPYIDRHHSHQLQSNVGINRNATFA